MADIYRHACRKQRNWINSKNYQDIIACNLLHILAIGSWKIVNRSEATPNSISSEVEASTAACSRAQVTQGGTMTQDLVIAAIEIEGILV